ncbi:MAG: STAS domain-containing protein [Pseudomonadota bacterium]
MSDIARFKLPSRLVLTSAAELARALLERADADLELDAAGTRQIGTPGLQVLLSARKTWESEGNDLTLVNFGEELEDQLAQFGLAPIDLQTGFGALPGDDATMDEE